MSSVASYNAVMVGIQIAINAIRLVNTPFQPRRAGFVTGFKRSAPNLLQVEDSGSLHILAIKVVRAQVQVVIILAGIFANVFGIDTHIMANVIEAICA